MHTHTINTISDDVYSYATMITNTLRFSVSYQGLVFWNNLPTSLRYSLATLKKEKNPDRPLKKPQKPQVKFLYNRLQIGDVTREVEFLSNDYTDPITNPKTLMTLALTLADL